MAILRSFEFTFYFSEEKDEPYAWEAREYLRKKLIGQEVKFIPAKNGGNTSSDREMGKLFFPKDDDNSDIAKELVANGLAKLKGNRPKNPDEDLKELIELEDKAKQEKKGLWNTENKEKVSLYLDRFYCFDENINYCVHFQHIRNIKYIKDNYEKFLAEYGNKPLQAIIESVRHNKYMMMMDVLILPQFISTSFALSGLNVSIMKSG